MKDYLQITRVNFLKIIMLRLSLVTLLLVTTLSATVAQTGSIKGTIVDGTTNEPLIGASVLVEGTTGGAAADLDGNFVIQNLKPGTYTLRATYIAYTSQVIEGVVVEAGKETQVQIAMSTDNVSLDEVEVIARANRESENILLMEQRKALVATQAVGARELSRKGIGDAQAAVAQVSGISKQEGVKNVFVRGLGDRYNTTTLNGFPIPSEDPEYKNIALEFFGTDVIQNIGVSKVFSGRDYSDVGGAIIDISSKELTNDYALTVNLSAGVNAVAIGADNFLKQESSNYFGFAKTQQPAEGDHIFVNSLDPRNVSFPMNHSYGISGGKSFLVGENRNPLSFFVVASHSTDYSYTKEALRGTTIDGTIWQDQTGDRYSQDISQLLLGNLLYQLNRKHNLQYNFMLVHANNQYVGEFSGVNMERHQDVEAFGSRGFVRRQQTNDNLLLVHQILSDWQLSNSLRLELGASYNKIKGLEPDRRENYFSLREDGDYNLTKSDRNKRFFSDLNNNDINAKAILTYQLTDRFGSENSSIIGGYIGRFISENFNAIDYHFKPNTPSLPESVLSNVNELFENGLNDGTIRMEKGEENSYDVIKNIHSAFGEVTYQVAKSLTANAGLRMDIVDLTVPYKLPGKTGEGTINKNYFLPSLNLKYDINDKNSLRLGASKSYTLPQSKEISPYQYISISFASEGNPDIKPSDNYNLDVKWDYYLSNNELLSLTGFYKYISNPIGRVDEGNSAGLLTYSNISDYANVGGVELELRKNIFNRFDTQHEQMNRLSAGLNLSYIYTDLLLKIENTTPRNSGLEGASPFLMNADLSYSYSKKDKNLTASLIFNYFSNRIHTLGAKGFEDIMEEGVPTLDFAASYSFNRNLSVKLNAANLLNAPYRLSRKSSVTDDKVVLNEFKKGQKISLGVSYDF